MVDGELGAQQLVRVVLGDLDAFARLERGSNTLVQQWAAQLPELMLRPDGLLAVLRALEQGEASPTLVQRWASFVRRGYFNGADREPLRPIGINYAPTAEPQIVEVLARLDELGDQIDGTIEDDELRAMIITMQGAAGLHPQQA
jgi:hypothetical protein